MSAICVTDSFVRMELRQLEYFIAVADEMSFTRAAQRVHVVQSALSTSIKKLEDELAVQLFDRSRQQIRLTPAGERLREHARHLLHSARLAKDSLSDFRGHLTGTVDFGSLVTFGKLDVAQGTRRIPRGPPVRSNQVAAQPDPARLPTCPRLPTGRSIWRWCRHPTGCQPGMDMHVIAEEPMVFVCRADHRLAGSARVDHRRPRHRGPRRLPGGVRHPADDRRRVRRRGRRGGRPTRCPPTTPSPRH